MASNEEDATLLIDDLDTLSYFSPTLTRKPSPLPSTSTIISSLLSSAGLSSSYPPADVTTLITSIETSSTFDTLRRNGLLLYLLIDVSTSPSVIDAFCNARLIPTFWRTSVEAYHAFDHGQYGRAMPYLSKENAEPYTELILRRLDAREEGKLARYALQFLKVARPDVVKASREAQQSVLIAKAIGEGLAAALELARTIDPAASAAQALWPWLFAKRRPKLLAEFVRLPLTPQEIQGVRDFALAPTAAAGSSVSSGAAQRRAIDALLLRLLNAGQVVEALRLDREAEEHGLGGDAEDGDEASAAAVKQRREMLRLARQSLPATLRLELEDDDGEEAFEGGNGRAAGMQVDGAGDVSMSGAVGGSRAPSRTGLLNKTTAATPSSPLVTLPRSASRNLALASQSPLAGSGLGGSSSSSFTGSPRPHARGSLPLPRAGYASPSPRMATSALPPTAAGAAAARQADASMQASTSFSSSSNAAGPYARLAAQLASSQQQQQSANDSGSALLSSLLPQKRAALSSASLASRGGASGDTIMAAAGAEGDVSMDRTMTPPPQPSTGSAFEVPKRRYVAKASASATGNEEQQSVGRARGQRQRQRSQAAADGGAAKSRAQRGVGASPHKKQRQMERDEQEEEEQEEPAKERQATTTKARLPRSRSTMPGSFFGDDEEMHEGQHEGEAEHEAEAEPAKSSTRATRTVKGKTTAGGGASSARRGSKDAAAAAAAPRRKTTATPRRRRETSTTSSLAPTSPSAHEDEVDETYAPPTTRRMTRSQSVMSAVSDAAVAGAGEDKQTYDTWTSGTTGDNTARDPLYEQREEDEEDEEDEGEEGEQEETDEEGQQGGRRRSRTRTSSSGGRKTTKQSAAAGGAKRSTRQRSAQPTSSTPKTSPQKRRTGAAGTLAAAAGTASATSTPRRSTRRGGA